MGKSWCRITVSLILRGKNHNNECEGGKYYYIGAWNGGFLSSPLHIMLYKCILCMYKLEVALGERISSVLRQIQDTDSHLVGKDLLMKNSYTKNTRPFNTHN